MDPHILKVQEKIFTPVGMPITIVAAVKYPRVSTSNPTVNMWCAHTIQPKIPIEAMAYTIPIFPKISFLPDIKRILLETIPKAGKIKI